MGNQRGQATILIGIIFQLVFIFFAMVINVGLLVNDKINLQNSVDIAAYYGAMKQAEVLNTMAQVNFQIRQAWKLLNWRLWVLGDIGRNPNFENFVAGHYDPNSDTPPPEAKGGDFPSVCVRNPLWSEEHFNEVGGEQTAQNFCKDTVFSIPPLKILKLGAAQSSPIFGFLKVFEAQSVNNATIFGKDCAHGGPTNFYYAALIAASYKTAVAHRRNAMRQLQDLLVGQDLKDISGRSVQETVDTVFKKNLTLANRESIQDFEFVNSLAGRPFLVPIDLRLFMRYGDISGGTGTACNGKVKFLSGEGSNFPQTSSDPLTQELIKFISGATQSDYLSAELRTAEIFARETPEKTMEELRSLVGFEKDPWTLAYVKVKAQTKPHMLFTPSNSGVVLTAESYAMPFGGRLGPWYRDSWGFGQEKSSGANKVDALLPLRIGEAGEIKPGYAGTEPNYSRFPGDLLGMKSQLSRTMALKQLSLANNYERPHLKGDDYGSMLINLTLPRQDPLVVSSRPFLRNAEIEATSPDIFDAVYYSIQDRFYEDVTKYSGSVVYNQICPFGCEDMGTEISPTKRIPFNIEKQITSVTVKDRSVPFWKIKSPDHLNTGWSQEDTDRYLPPGGDISRLIGSSQQLGGRVGYSVKTVSAKFLHSPMILGGAAEGAHKIKNLPQ